MDLNQMVSTQFSKHYTFTLTDENISKLLGYLNFYIETDILDKVELSDLNHPKFTIELLATSYSSVFRQNLTPASVSFSIIAVKKSDNKEIGHRTYKFDNKIHVCENLRGIVVIVPYGSEDYDKLVQALQNKNATVLEKLIHHNFKFAT
jgi:hypothetical protein